MIEISNIVKNVIASYHYLQVFHMFPCLFLHPQVQCFQVVLKNQPAIREMKPKENHIF